MVLCRELNIFLSSFAKPSSSAETSWIDWLSPSFQGVSLSVGRPSHSREKRRERERYVYERKNGLRALRLSLAQAAPADTYFERDNERAEGETEKKTTRGQVDMSKKK